MFALCVGTIAAVFGLAGHQYISPLTAYSVLYVMPLAACPLLVSAACVLSCSLGSVANSRGLFALCALLFFSTLFLLLNAFSTAALMALEREPVPSSSQAIHWNFTASALLQFVVGICLFACLFRRLVDSCATVNPAQSRRANAVRFFLFLGLFVAGEVSPLWTGGVLLDLLPKSVDLAEVAPLDRPGSRRLRVTVRGYASACDYMLLRRRDYFAGGPGKVRSGRMAPKQPPALDWDVPAGHWLGDLASSHVRVDSGMFTVPGVGAHLQLHGRVPLSSNVVTFSERTIVAAYPLSAGEVLLSVDVRGLRQGEYLLHVWTTGPGADATIAFRVEKPWVSDLWDRLFYRPLAARRQRVSGARD